MSLDHDCPHVTPCSPSKFLPNLPRLVVHCFRASCPVFFWGLLRASSPAFNGFKRMVIHIFFCDVKGGDSSQTLLLYQILLLYHEFDFFLRSDFEMGCFVRQ